MKALRWLLLSNMALAACGGSPTNPSSDWIEIKAITPTQGTALKAGDSVTFNVTVGYTLGSADGATISLALIDHTNRTLNGDPPGPPSSHVTKGSGTLNFTSTVTLPGSGSTVTAMAPLFLDGVNRTAFLAKTTTYQVQ